MNDLNNSKDFSTIKPFAFWTQHVLPLVYGDEISYMETLDKVVKLLNELIKNNNKLPDYIQKIVEEYITGGPLEEVLSGILANFILNVKYPPTGITPAKGDGTVNDYEAIQGCIDYAANKGGGVVYFPFGKYLTSKLTIKPGVSLMGFGEYCTSIVLTGGETGSLINGTVNDCGIYNLTLDGNMSIQVNNVDVVTLTGYDIQLMNVILTDGFTLFNIEKTGDNIELNNVEFRYAIESMLRIGGNVGSVNADNVTFGSLSTINGVAAIISDSDNNIITGIVSNKVLPLFAELDGNNNILEGKVSSTNLINGDGHGNVYNFYCRAKNETYSGDVGETVHGNKSVHIGGTYTRAIDNNSTESVDGTKSEVVTGVSSAQYNDDRSVKGKNITETLNGKKVVTCYDIEETIANAKTINAKDVILNIQNPLTYGSPENGYIEIKSATNDKVYKVYLDNTILSTKFFGIKGDGSDETTKLQNAINYCVNNACILKIEDTIGISDTIILPSNTTIWLAGVILCLDPVKAHITNLDGKAHPLYSGNGNITIFGNGKINVNGNAIDSTLSALRFFHAKNIKIIGITIENYGDYHAIEIGGIDNALISMCKFTGQIKKSTTQYVIETIQYEKCDGEGGQYGAIPYDHTPCMNITIEKCLFKADTGYTIDCGVGGQSGGYFENPHKNINIVDNVFDGLKFECVRFFDLYNSRVTGNMAINCGYGLCGCYVYSVTANYNLIINNNKIIDCGNDIKSARDYNAAISVGKGSNIEISGNIIANYLGFSIVTNNTTDVNIISNTILNPCKFNPLNNISSYNVFNFDASSDINIVGNIIKVENDTKTNSICTITDGVNFIGNLVDIPTTYKTYNDTLLSPSTIIYSGEQGVGTNIPFTNANAFINATSLLIVYIIKGVGRMYKIYDIKTLSSQCMETMTNITTNPEWYQISFSVNKANNTFSVNKSAKGVITDGVYTPTLGTNSDDSPVVIANIYALRESNLTKFNNTI